MPVDQTDFARPCTEVVRALGRRVRVTATGSGAARFCAEFETAWDILLDREDSAVDDELAIDLPAATEAAVAGAMAAAEAQITLAAITGNIGAGLLFHAAAMTGESGAATLLVGPSGAGKTTAVRHFGRHHGYVTDEIALVRDGRVAGYQKPLSLVSGGSTSKTQRSANELGLVPTTARESVVERVVVLDRRPDAREAMVATRLGMTEGIFALVPHLSSLTASRQPLVSLARLVARVGGVERLTYRSIDALDPRRVPSAEPLAAKELVFTLPADSSPATVASTEHRLLIRTAPHDAIETLGTLIVARGETVTALEGVSRTLWHETRTPKSMCDLLSAVRAVHGRVDRDDAITASTVRQLVEHGILRWLG